MRLRLLCRGYATAAEAGAGRMWAWRAHSYCADGVSEVRLEEARVPPLRAPDHVLVRVRAASLNPIDVRMLAGYGARVLNLLRAFDGDGDAAGVEFPLVLGRDFVGEVVRAGPAAAARLPVGARVWGALPPHAPGSHAQYVLVKDHWACRAPARLADAEAAGLPYAGLAACAALRAAGLRPGAPLAPATRVLLLGLGGAGATALQLLALAGAQVVVGCGGAAATRALRLGAAAARDRRAPDYLRQVADAGPYCAVLDMGGLGGAGAAAGARAGWKFSRYVTLSPPLLRAMDERGALLGLGAAAALGAAHSAAALGASPAAASVPPLPPLPHVRWAFFSPNADDLRLLRRLADRGQLVCTVERTWGWRAARGAYERAAAAATDTAATDTAASADTATCSGKLVIDFTDDSAAD